MAAQVKTVAALPPSASPSSATLSQEDRARLREFDRIVQFRDSVTSGKHPRIKIPAHLLRVPSASSLSADPPARAATHTEKGKQINSLAHQKNHETAAATWSAPAAGRSALPGLGMAAASAGKSGMAAAAGTIKKPGTFDPVLLEKSDSLVRAEFALKRGRIEARLRALADAAAANAKADEEEAGMLDLTDVLQKARELERTFTPPPGVAAAGEANQRGGEQGHAQDDGSDDDATFYSSKFSTPEFAPKPGEPAGASNGAGAGAGADAVSVADSSDYEPEIDGPPLAGALLQPPLAQQGPAPWESGLSGVSGGFPSTDSGPVSSGESSYQRPPVGEEPCPPSPFIHRAHDLSPIAPQPSHVSSMAAVAAVAQLPLVTPGPQQQQQQSQPQPRPQLQPYAGPQSAPAQVAQLRKGEAAHSSAESSQADRDRRRDKKRGVNANKRKADRPASPRIKVEVRSESPVLLPAPPRPLKRQRHLERQAERAARRAQRQQAQQEQDVQGALRNDDPYSPSLPQAAAAPDMLHGAYYPPPPRNDRMSVVYEDGTGELYERPPPATGRPVYARQPQAYGVYDAVPVYAQPARPSTVVPPDYVPAARLHRQPYAEAPPPAGYQYEPPEYATSPVLMAPPPPASRMAYRQQQSPPHIVTDEYGREYYEPSRPAVAAVRQGPPPPEMAVYERPLSRQHYVLPPQQQQQQQQQRLPARAVSQMPPPTVYEDRSRGGYGEAPVYVQAPARRVFTQPEYVTQEAPAPGPGHVREYSVVRASQPPQPPQPPPYGYHPQMVRATTAVPHDVYNPYEPMPAAPPGRYAEEPMMYQQRPAYSVRPEQAAVRAMSVLPGSGPGSGPGPGPAAYPQYYVNPPAPGEGYADDGAALYR